MSATPEGSIRPEAIRQPRVCLIADDPDDLRRVRPLLDAARSEFPCEIRTCAGIEEARAVFAEEEPDVVILDLGRGSAGGLDALAELQRSRPGVSVILWVDDPGACTAAQASRFGALDLLHKRTLDPHLLARSLRYAAERRKSRTAMRRRTDRFSAYQAVLLDLSRLPPGDLEGAFRLLTRADAEALGVERVGIWLFDDAHPAIICECLHVRSRGAYERGVRLEAARYPRYFEALAEHRVVAATDAPADPRTGEFADSYLRPLGIGAMMDAPIRVHGRLLGIVCHEHVGGPREWTLEDQEFASSIADQAALLLEDHQRRHTETALLRERNLLRAVLDSTSMMVAVLDAAGRVVRCNQAFLHLTGRRLEETATKPFWELVAPPEEVDVFRQILSRPPSEASAHQHEHAWMTAHGARPRIAWTVRALGDDVPGAVVVTGLDVTERKALEEQLLHDAFHDSLTGLPNRALFLDRLGQALRQSLRHPDRRFGVLFVDMDRFKMVNDGLGHLVGDRFLAEIARRVSGSVRPGDTVARFGGDEFTLLLADLRGGGDAAQVAERIHEQLKEPIRLAGQEIYTTASIGIALSETGYERPEDMLRDADIAMYRAKARGGGGHEVFDRSMYARAVELLRTETDLRQALERGEFEVHYQPIVMLESGEVSGFEALIRWNHPERGRIVPADFIRVAEETGLIIELDRWVLRQACRQVKEWEAARPRGAPLSISVNFSARQFGRSDLVDVVRRVLQETGLPSGRLCLEITESVLLDAAPAAADVLEQLRAVGARLHLDDFGTGYSSLSYLHRFPVDALKIDRSFVSGLRPDGGGQVIVRTIVALAQNLNLTVIAEGVENVGQRSALRHLNCEFGQGYMFAKPVPAGEATALLRSGLPLG